MLNCGRCTNHHSMSWLACLVGIIWEIPLPSIDHLIHHSGLTWFLAGFSRSHSYIAGWFQTPHDACWGSATSKLGEGEGARDVADHLAWRHWDIIRLVGSQWRMAYRVRRLESTVVERSQQSKSPALIVEGTLPAELNFPIGTGQELEMAFAKCAGCSDFLAQEPLIRTSAKIMFKTCFRRGTKMNKLNFTKITVPIRLPQFRS